MQIKLFLRQLDMEDSQLTYKHYVAIVLLNFYNIMCAVQGITCAREFYLYNGSVCRPLCHIWVSGNVTEDIVKDVFTIIISVICLLSCGVLVLFAFILQRGEM